MIGLIKIVKDNGGKMSLTGRHVTCPKCKKNIQVPDHFHDFPCPDCGETIKDKVGGKS